MFYQGTLQEGISTAVGQQKLVLCFVTDKGDESEIWENDFLADETLNDLLKDHAVALRLEAGSEEAGYLAQIFPLPRTPTIVIIKNGELKEYITPGAAKEDFIRRIQSAFDSAPHPAPSVAQPTEPSTIPTQPEPAAVPAPAQDPPVTQPAPPNTSSSESVRRILAERAARLQAQKEKAEAKAKEDRAKKEEKARADAEAGLDTDNAKAHKQAETLKKRRQLEEEERKRILKRIEDDKAERKLRAAEREQQRVDSIKGGDVAAALTNAPASKVPTSKATGMTALQVRLFDGSTLRSRFESKSPLKNIRKWVDENRTDGAQPYKFKQVLTPLPNKNIDDTEESQPIGELGLSPSSTLVLIPVNKYTSAYGESSQNIFSRLIGLIMGFFTWLLSLFGANGSQNTERESDNDSPGPSRERTQAEGLRNRNQRDQQLYNGNSLNFEPRPDEDKEG